MSEILQPCPFCGGTNICTEKGINLNYCDSCSAEANIEHWNNRPIEDALQARIAELSQAVGLITTLKPTMVMDAEHPLEMAKEVAEYVTARIAELEAESERFTVHSDIERQDDKWIPVSERLPECEKDVLVFWGKASDGSKIDWFGTAWRNECDDGKWCTDPIVPTHWMPLPEPPIVYGKVCEE
jgi:hypothetical protein